MDENPYQSPRFMPEPSPSGRRLLITCVVLVIIVGNVWWFLKFVELYSRL